MGLLDFAPLCFELGYPFCLLSESLLSLMISRGRLRFVLFITLALFFAIQIKGNEGDCCDNERDCNLKEALKNLNPE